VDSRDLERAQKEQADGGNTSCANLVIRSSYEYWPSSPEAVEHWVLILSFPRSGYRVVSSEEEEEVNPYENDWETTFLQSRVQVFPESTRGMLDFYCSIVLTVEYESTL